MCGWPQSLTETNSAELLKASGFEGLWPSQQRRIVAEGLAPLSTHHPTLLLWASGRGPTQAELQCVGPGPVTGFTLQAELGRAVADQGFKQSHCCNGVHEFPKVLAYPLAGDFTKASLGR